jgi:hypothetical protein
MLEGFERALRLRLRAGDVSAVRLSLKLARLRSLEREALLEPPVPVREVTEQELAELVADIRADSAGSRRERAERAPWKPGDRPRAVYIVRGPAEEGDG